MTIFPLNYVTSQLTLGPDSGLFGTFRDERELW
jgi:hypothetical protein